MQTYKIQLLSNERLGDYQEFLHVTSENLEHRLTLISEGHKPVIPYTSDKWDREEDLDLFKATAWQHRLTQLGVECQIVEVDYSKEP